ncbi:MAG: hemerythrin domain-containing protein [Phycisphaerales bacterium]
MSGDDFTNPPIKRHAALVPLSRDHYAGLVHAHRMMKAAGGDRVARHKVLAEFLDEWDRTISEHFDDEERLLGDLASEDDRRRLLEEHRALRDQVHRARQWRKSVDPDAEALAGLGGQLEAHIRWEERELFNRVQASSDAAALEALQRETADIESRRGRHRGGAKSAEGDGPSCPSRRATEP